LFNSINCSHVIVRYITLNICRHVPCKPPLTVPAINRHNNSVLLQYSVANSRLWNKDAVNDCVQKSLITCLLWQSHDKTLKDQVLRQDVFTVISVIQIQSFLWGGGNSDSILSMLNKFCRQKHNTVKKVSYSTSLD